MQSDSGGPIVDNPSMDIQTFGIDDEETDVGLRIEVGDGLSGVSVDFIDLENESNTSGTLTDDWGNMMAGDSVNTRLHMSNLRLRWLLGHRFALDDSEVWEAGVGLGPMLAHRRLRMTVSEVTGLRAQKMEVEDDGQVYLAARGQVSWSNLALTADYAISDDWNFGGEFDGTQQDLEVMISYTTYDGRLALFGGYQYSAFPASGSEGPFDFDADFTLDGYLFGLTIIF